MNYNDKLEAEEGFILHTQEDEQYPGEMLKLSDSENRIDKKYKPFSNHQAKGPLIRGKENDCSNISYGVKKNAVTNHSFNDYFNDNIQKPNKFINQSIQQNIQFMNIQSKTYQMNSPANFNSSGKLSNLQFIGDLDSSKSSNQHQQLMHSQVKQMMEKYFFEILQSGNFYGQYISIPDFVNVLFQEFQHLIGKENSVSLIEDFSDKTFEIFGDRIYFDALFEKTSSKGLTGLILQVFKSIGQNKNHMNDSKDSKIIIKQTIPQQEFIFRKNSINQNMNCFKAQRNSSMNGGSNQNLDQFSRASSTKISLDKFFGNSFSKVQFQQNSTQISQENLEQVKQILQDYIEGMYEEAEQKLSKKYSQEMRKITIKYKEVQKLLQKINEKISNHYDSLQLSKQYEKKIKLLKEKQSEMQNKITKLQNELKISKDDLQKQKLMHFKTDQEFVKIKEKLQKYENAIFERAMAKDLTQTSINSGSMIKQPIQTDSSIYPQSNPINPEPSLQNSKFEVKINTITQHRPFIAPLSPLNSNQSTYSPYFSRIVSKTPTRVKQAERTSVSPIRQRISFVKTQNPTQNMKSPVNQNERPVSPGPSGQNSRLLYSGVTNVSRVEKVQLGEKISLRPLSPINKVSQSNINGANQNLKSSSVKINPLSQVNQPTSQGVYSITHISSQRNLSPIKVQFCTSRVTMITPENR